MFGRVSFEWCDRAAKGEGSSRTIGLENSQNLVTCANCQQPSNFFPVTERPHTSDDADLGNAVGVTQDDTDLRGSSTLLGELADLLDDLVGGGLQPRRGGARVGNCGGRNALSVAVKTTHGCWLALAVISSVGRSEMDATFFQMAAGEKTKVWCGRVSH